MTSPAKQVAAITASLAREQTYVLMMRPNPDAPPIESRDPLRIEHHGYLLDLERRGILFAAGPFADRGEKPSGSGMIIIRAASHEDAARIGSQEPYTRDGQRLMDVLPWQRNEGTLKLELRLADGVLKIDDRTYTLTKSGASDRTPRGGD
jgi:uncharacterized protein YciI